MTGGRDVYSAGKHFAWRHVVLCLGCLVIAVALCFPAHGFQPPDNIAAKEELPIEGVSIVRTEQGDTYIVSKDGRYIFQGRLYDVWNGMEIDSAEKLERYADRVDLDHIGVSDDKLFAFALGSGDKEVHVFVDPYCPHCHELVKQIRASDELRESYLFRVVVAPISSQKSTNRARKLAALAQQNATQAVEAFVNNTYPEGKVEQEGFPGVEYNLLVARALSIQSVPYLVAPDGRIEKGRPGDLAAFLRSGKPGSKNEPDQQAPSTCQGSSCSVD